MYSRIFASFVVLIVLAAPLRAQEVVGFTLIDASTDQEIRPLRDGETIDFKAEGAELNIRVDVRGSVDSVRFDLNNGQWTDTETAPPFSIGGDSRGDYNAWMPPAGEYRLTVVPFADGSGAQGKARTIAFAVVGTPKRAPLRISQPSSPSPIQVLQSDVELGAIAAPVGGTGVVEGDLMEWHCVRITFDGPSSSENAKVNPFAHYRLNVTFTNGEKTYVAPGFYAADGNAAESSARAGNKWCVFFTPDCDGEWRVKASFRMGVNIAVNPELQAGAPTAFDGASGTFRVAKSDKKAPDFRAKGLLQYVGEHYLKHAGNGQYFIKGGADSPENFLAYAQFDDTYDASADSGSYRGVGTFIHEYKAHMKDWRPGDPTWKGGKGKEIIGMLNYLAGKGMNSVYFLTYNIDGGDGRDTWMWTGSQVRDRYDCSKLDQWEIVFTHMDRLGIMLHVVTQETENDRNLGGSAGLNPVRKLYYRELVARFSHHLAVLWNLGEENNTSDADRRAIARYIRDLDPYNHPIAVHTKPNRAPDFYNGILGDPCFEMTSIQADLNKYNNDAVILRRRSARAGRKWAICGDEQQPAREGVVPDANDPTHDKVRKHALWGNLMGGGSGVEWYFGSRFPHMDINCEDWRTRENMWDQTRYALEFFHDYLPFARMAPDNALTSNPKAYCLAKPGEVYAIYLLEGGSADLNAAPGIYSVQWYNPRTGGELLRGSVRQITGPGKQSIGRPPKQSDKDWAVLVHKTTP
ncbi:MAG: DUF5060 domain-containing protein [Planctomycetota bacterium]|jgi:hypothetical protein